MLSSIITPPSPTLGRIGLVTISIKQNDKQTFFNIDELGRTSLSNNAWKFRYVAAGSGWTKVASTPGIHIFGKFDNFYEIVLDDAYFQWLHNHGFQLLDKAQFEVQFGYDPTKREPELGRRFLDNAFTAIWSRRSPGLDMLLRSIAPSHLQIALEWAILNRDIQESTPLVRNKFTLCIVFLISHEDYNNSSAVQLLERNQHGVLQAFRKDPADLLDAALAGCQNYKAKAQLIGPIRWILALAGGPEDDHQLVFDQEHTPFNINLLGSLVNTINSNCFRDVDLKAISNALSRSGAITGECIDALQIAETIQLMSLLSAEVQSSMTDALPYTYSVYDPSSNIHTFCVLSAGVYELKKPLSNRKMGDGNKTLLRISEVINDHTTSQKLEDTNVWLPWPLQEDKQVTFLVNNDGSFEVEGTRWNLHKGLIRVARIMQIGQKLLIVEEKDREKETRIWTVEILYVGSGYLSFGQDVPRYSFVLEKKSKMSKVVVRERIRNTTKKRRVECSGCGLRAIVSYIYHKFLDRSSNRGFVTL
ncbi:hypothetical protein B0O99DRAFT_632669 [Bisporella sp. PMI_857]|nr:hypothetical protein B0O99DRAFT_632669 [Bisporella sp. PMI_857]